MVERSSAAERALALGVLFFAAAKTRSAFDRVMRRPDGRPPRKHGDAVAVETVRAIAALRDADEGNAPTRRNLARALGLSSVATVIERLGVLKRRGLVDYEIGTMRSLCLTSDGERLAAASTVTS